MKLEDVTDEFGTAFSTRSACHNHFMQHHRNHTTVINSTMETQTNPNAAQSKSGSGQTGDSSVIGGPQTGANSTVLGGSFDEIKNVDPIPGEIEQPIPSREIEQPIPSREIEQPVPSSVPGVGQPQIPTPDIHPQTDQPEIQEPLGDEGYDSNDNDRDGSQHSDSGNLNEQSGYNELNKDQPIQNPTRTEEPSVSEETEEYPR